MKEDARTKAESIFREAKGKISNVEIARQVGVNALTVGKWKGKYDWAASPAKVKKPRPPRKKEALEQALQFYLESGGNISNKALGDKVGVSNATIANWKKAGTWLEKLAPQMPEEPAVTEAQLEAPREEATEPQREAVPSEAAEEDQEIEVDLDEIARPDHFTVLNQRIDEMLGRDYLSPQDLKIAAEAKEAVLSAVAAYLEVLERGSRF